MVEKATSLETLNAALAAVGMDTITSSMESAPWSFLPGDPYEDTSRFWKESRMTDLVAMRDLGPVSKAASGAYVPSSTPASTSLYGSVPPMTAGSSSMAKPKSPPPLSIVPGVPEVSLEDQVEFEVAVADPRFGVW